MAASLSARNAAALARQVEAFNLAHPIGAKVRFWTGRKGEGPGRLGEVEAPGAFVLSGRTPSVFITGQRGCIALSHVEGAA